MATTTISNIPVEIILAVADYLPELADVDSLAQASRHLYSILNPYLYRQDVQRHGITTLWWAAEMAEIGTARHTLDQGADIHGPDRGIDDAFFRAVWHMSNEVCLTHDEFLLFLLSRGADINARNSHGWTALHCADINALTPDGQSVLHLAVVGNCLDKIRSILDDEGVSINAPGHNGNTPLHTTVKTGRISVATPLLDNGADVNSRNDTGSTPLHMATSEFTLYNIENKAADVAHLLLNRGADIDARDRSGRTPVHTPASTPSEYIYTEISDLYQVFRDRSANTEAVDDKGVSVFERARKSGNWALIEALKRRSSRLR